MATKPKPPPAKPKPKPKAPMTRASAGGVVYVEPSFRAYQPWNPQLLLGAELLCDGGTLRAAGDLCEQMLGDDRLFAVIHKLVDGMLGLDVTFEAAGAKKRPPKALEAGEDWWDMFPEAELSDVLVWGVLLGAGLGQIPWKPKPKTPRLVCELEAWSPRHLTWDWNTRQWKLRVDPGGGAPEDIVITPGDGNWMLYTPYGRKRPWAKAPWRGLSRWWLLKQYAIYDWGKYSERHGQGSWVGEPLPGMSPGLLDRKQLAADLQAMARAANIVLPPGYSLKLVEATANNWQTFKAQTDMANMAYAITLLGNNLSTEVTSGSFAAASVHQAVEQAKLKWLSTTASTFTHDQALGWWAAFNFGSEDEAPWGQWAVDPPEDLKSAAELMAAFGQGLKAFATYKIPVDIKALCDRFKIPLIEGAPIPDLLEPPPPPPNPFGGPPPPGSGPPGKPGEPPPKEPPPPTDADDEPADEDDEPPESKPEPKPKPKKKAA